MLIYGLAVKRNSQIYQYYNHRFYFALLVMMSTCMQAG